MKRRNFIKTTIAGSGVLAIGTYGENAHQSVLKETLTSEWGGSDFSLMEETIDSLQQKMKNGQITSLHIVQKYIARINSIDKDGPRLNAIIELNPDAEKIAGELDEERQKGKIRSNLHGIPILIKDNINTADKMSTSAGSLALKDFHAGNDAFIINKLRIAGAVILGKTNLSEWANFRSNNSSSGWSGRGGLTRNPYSVDRSPCGSSSGSGVAVSANLCTLAIGTETDGSIICPSGINGIVGIKPTLGLWSRSGIIPIAYSQDTAGPMARTVTDAAYLLGLLTGVDLDDPETVKSKEFENFEFSKFLNRESLKGSRIGVLRNFFGFDNNVDILMENAIVDMKAAGAQIIDNINYDKINELGEAEWTVLLYEFKHYLNQYFNENANSPVRTLSELIEFDKQHASEEMQWFGQDIFELAQSKGNLNEDEYKTALQKAKVLSQSEGIDKLIDENQLDALIAPTNGSAWTIDLINGDHYKGGSSSLAAIAGYPSITVPAGFVHDLPIGLSFIGKAWSEEKLIGLAYAYEQLTLHRKIPEFKIRIE
jgi:amidase